KHPFHRRMNAGALAPEAIRSWVANRFYYQRNIPRKDAFILANCPLREVRRLWIHRIHDHDGVDGSDGGIEAWLRLGEACGLERSAGDGAPSLSYPRPAGSRARRSRIQMYRPLGDA